MVTETIEERIKRIDARDLRTLSYSELETMKRDINSDLKFVEYKRKYYYDFCNELRRQRDRIIQKMYDARDKCEICHNPFMDNEPKTLPDERNVCKACWKVEVDNRLNLNVIELTGNPELDKECIELYRKTKREKLLKLNPEYPNKKKKAAML